MSLEETASFIFHRMKPALLNSLFALGVTSAAVMFLSGCATTTQMLRRAITSTAIAEGSSICHYGLQTLRMTATVVESDETTRKPTLIIVMETTDPLWPEELFPSIVLFRPKSAKIDFNGLMFEPDKETIKIIGELIAESDFEYASEGNKFKMRIPLVRIHSGLYELQVFFGDNRGNQLQFCNPRVLKR